MRVLPRLALMAAILLPAAAFGESKIENDANTTRWWLDKAMADIPKIKSAEVQFQAYRHLLEPASRDGAPEIVTKVTAELEKLVAANPAFKLDEVNPKMSLDRAKILEQAKLGNHEAALAMAKKSNVPSTFQDIARTLAYGGKMEQLRAMATDSSLDKTLSAQCWSYIYEDAVAKGDKKTAEEITKQTTNLSDRASSLRNQIQSTIHMDGSFEDKKAIFLGELLPLTKESDEALATLAGMLARQGYTKEVVIFGLRVQGDDWRPGALYQVCRALATDGKSDEAATIAEKETRKENAASAYRGLAVGLALHNEADAAREVFKKANRAANDPEFAVALAFGPVLKSAGKEGLDKFKATGDSHQQILIVQDVVRYLVVKNKLEEAIAVSAAYPGKDVSSLQSRGHLLYYVALAYRAAGNEAGVKQTIKAMDDLQALVEEKDKTEATKRLISAHTYVGDGEGALALIATLPDAKERDRLRESIAETLATAGDIKGAAKAFESMEAKLPENSDKPLSAARSATRSGRFPELGAWIGTWTNDERRVQAYMVVAQYLDEMLYQRRLGRTSLF